MQDIIFNSAKGRLAPRTTRLRGDEAMTGLGGDTEFTSVTGGENTEKGMRKPR